MVLRPWHDPSSLAPSPTSPSVGSDSSRWGAATPVFTGPGPSGKPDFIGPPVRVDGAGAGGAAAPPPLPQPGQLPGGTQPPTVPPAYRSAGMIPARVGLPPTSVFGVGSPGPAASDFNAPNVDDVLRRAIIRAALSR